MRPRFEKEAQGNSEMACGACASQDTHTFGAYPICQPCLCSMHQLGVLYFLSGRDASPSQTY